MARFPHLHPNPPAPCCWRSALPPCTESGAHLKNSRRFLCSSPNCLVSTGENRRLGCFPPPFQRLLTKRDHLMTTRPGNPRTRTFGAALLLASALCAPALLHAQSAVVGALGNFDAANFEGKDAHGMEIQIEGILPGDLMPAWCGN